MARQDLLLRLVIRTLWRNMQLNSFRMIAWCSNSDKPVWKQPAKISVRIRLQVSMKIYITVCSGARYLDWIQSGGKGFVMKWKMAPSAMALAAENVISELTQNGHEAFGSEAAFAMSCWVGQYMIWILQLQQCRRK